MALWTASLLLNNYFQIQSSVIFVVHRIRSDHNEDATPDVLRDWISIAQKVHDYHSINSEILSSPPQRMTDENGPAHWTPLRFTHVIQLREEALDTARNMWADYVWVSEHVSFCSSFNFI